MTIYTVKYNYKNKEFWTIAFKDLTHAKRFAENEDTGNVKVHNFKNMDKAEDFLRNKCSFADFAENEKTEDIEIIRQMSGID